MVQQFSHDLYFEGAGTILTLITLGKFFEARAKGRTSDAINRLLNLAPKTACVLRDGVETVIPAEEIVRGDVLVVRAGESVPVDGTILDGNASIDESAITGESIPVDKQTGDKVIGATINKSGYFQMRADKVGDETRLGADHPFGGRGHQFQGAHRQVGGQSGGHFRARGHCHCPGGRPLPG